jgi:DNA-binding CsgD family transcriptional regulator
MHRTPTIDYIVMLEGEVTLILDDGEVRLRPFDTLVQRGTDHAWSNRSGKPATFAVVTVDLAVAGLAPAGNRHALELAALYRLTPVEADIALALARGDRLSAIAAERGVSFNTVRTHAARLRHKMGAASQSEIVRMVLVHLGALSPAAATTE